MNYVLYDLEPKFEGYCRFKLSCSTELHELLQKTLVIEPYCTIPHADGDNLHRVTYYLKPDEAEQVYDAVQLLIQDYFDDIRLDKVWWDVLS